MKNITSGGVLARVSRFVPQDAIPPYRTVEEWREWQLAEGRKRSEEVNRLNHQTRVEKIINRSGIQPLHRKCTFGNYRVQNDGQRHSLSQAKSIAAELEGGCTNFVFSGRPGTGKNHLAAAIGNRLMEKGRSVIIITVSDVMSVLHDSYDNGKSGEKFLQELCGVDLLVLDEIGMQRDTRNEQVTLNQIVDRRTASLRSVGMLTNLNHAAMNTLLGERVMDRMSMNGGRWVTFNWVSWRPNVSLHRN
ncbi:ATP-binding protein [Escherichia coli]|uniref:ATP-binding protein n=1 Tax=Escherichia coli TaxID=562 RepID=UPI000846B8CB|nr:ATP-binding protein [Escherichia coli]AOM53316.1 DNA replication protein DnaC [Escherichia coli]AOM62464.1 DNA replication protein DnaC [Escherichia coli]EES9514315.1 ATP-binding protein [Escherichia coli]EET9103380.1 ATP-binding protein [Escherichia coli]EFE1834702.1 ATP-binding protein [Escherichia coli]